MKAIWRGQVIAESDRTIEVDGYRYFPRDSVRMDLLRRAPRAEAISPARTASSSTTSSRRMPRRASDRPGPTVPRDSMRHVNHWIGLWEDIEIA